MPETIDLVSKNLSNPNDSVMACFTAMRILVAQHTILALLEVQGHFLIVVFDVIDYSELRVHSSYAVTPKLDLILKGKQSSIELVLAGAPYRATFTKSVKTFLEIISQEKVNGKADIDLFALGYGGRIRKSEPDISESMQSLSLNPFILPDNQFNIKELDNIKKWYLAKNLRDKQLEFSTFSTINVFVGTWNVAGQMPNQDIKSWFGEADYDIFVFGLQEMDLSTQAYLINDGVSESAWAKHVEKALGSSFVRVGSKQMIGMLLMVYVKKEESESISEFSSTSIGQGFIGLGNKGAVSVRFRYKDSYFTFCNSHLASDLGMTERRNQDYNQISKKTIFDSFYYKDSHQYWLNNPWVACFYDSAGSLKGNGFSTQTTNIPFKDSTNLTSISLFDTDHLVWMGDLNYRLQLSNAEVKDLIAERDFPSLLANDQLLLQRDAKTVFNGFQEQTITFMPTYKYDIGTHEYDTSEKKRCPAYCDRILWKINPLNFEDQNWIHPITYKSEDSITTSDHKPVMASFEMKVRSLNQESLTETRNSIIKELEKLENDAYPLLFPSTSNLDFGTVSCINRKIVTFELENPGQVNRNLI